MRHHAGFSLVELVVVILVLGILAAGSVTYIRHASLGYASALDRSELASNARLALGRLERELRNALPGSLRSNGQCIEFVEADAGGSYLQLPVGSSEDHAVSVPLIGNIGGDSLRMAVFPVQVADIYALASPGPVSPAVTLEPPDAEGKVRVNFAAPHAFPEHSPTSRFYLISQPVSYCVHEGRLWRFSDYGFMNSQPAPTSLPANMPQRGLVGTGLQLDNPPFEVEAASLTRNAVVSIDLMFASGDDRLRIRHSVQVRNVP